MQETRADLGGVRSAGHTVRSLSWVEWRITLLIGVTFAAAGYDTALLGLALPQIQTDLGIAEQEVGRLLAIVRLAIIPALALALLADRVGRRRLLIGLLVGFSVCHAASALVSGPVELVVLQLLARTFALAEEMVAITLLAECLTARSRGLGLGVAAALEDLGFGHAAVSFGILGRLENGWRWLYAAGAIPLLALAWLRRAIPESPRFESAAPHPDGPTGPTAILARLRALARSPVRAVSLVVVCATMGCVGGAALTFAPKTLQEVHGYTPADVAKLMVGLGLLLLPVSLAAGALADRIGRRRVLSVLLLTLGGGAALFYSDEWRAMAPATWLLMMTGWAGCEVLVSAVGAEIFPTSVRVTAAGLRAVATALGTAGGLWAESLLVGADGDHGAAIQALTWLVVVGAVAVWALPETAGRELESIAPELGA